jgi:hypothetical protein
MKSTVSSLVAGEVTLYTRDSLANRLCRNLHPILLDQANTLLWYEIIGRCEGAGSVEILFFGDQVGGQVWEKSIEALMIDCNIFRRYYKS